MRMFEIHDSSREGHPSDGIAYDILAAPNHQLRTLPAALPGDTANLFRGFYAPSCYNAPEG